MRGPAGLQLSWRSPGVDIRRAGATETVDGGRTLPGSESLAPSGAAFGASRNDVTFFPFCHTRAQERDPTRAPRGVGLNSPAQPAASDVSMWRSLLVFGAVTAFLNPTLNPSVPTRPGAERAHARGQRLAIFFSGPPRRERRPAQVRAIGSTKTHAIVGLAADGSAIFGPPRGPRPERFRYRRGGRAGRARGVKVSPIPT